MVARIASFLVVGLILIPPAAASDGWGTLKGQFVWEGDVPQPELLYAKGASIKDKAVCAAQDLFAEDLVVDPDTKGIANIFIYLPKAPKAIHPDAADFDESVLQDQEYCRFTPHAMFVRAGQTVEVINSDNSAHNTHTYTLRNAGQNEIIPALTPAGKGKPYPTKVREILPITVQCDLHSWMKAYWLILDHPYAAVSAADGTFEIPNLPAGKHKFRVWHERKGYLERRLEVTIADGGMTDLGSRSYTIEKKD